MKKTESTIKKAAEQIASSAFEMGGALVSQGVIAAANLGRQEVEFKTTEAQARAVVNRLEDARARSESEKDPHIQKIIDAEVTYYEGELDSLANQVAPSNRIESHENV